MHGVSSDHTSMQALWKVSSGGPPIIDTCSACETLQATVAYKPSHIRYWDSIEPKVGKLSVEKSL